MLVSTTADDGPGSLRQAIADVPSGTPTVIGFEPALAGATITLDGDGVTGVLAVGPRGSLTLRNLTVTGSYDNVGAIIAFGTLRVEHSTITGNRAVAQGSGRPIPQWRRPPTYR